jgi:hypothetical protein
MLACEFAATRVSQARTEKRSLLAWILLRQPYFEGRSMRLRHIVHELNKRRLLSVAIKACEGRLTGDGSEWWTAINYGVINRLMPELAWGRSSPAG